MAQLKQMINKNKFYIIGTLILFLFLFYCSNSYIIILNTFNATVSVLNILSPNVTIFAPLSFNNFISLSSNPPSGPITIPIFKSVAFNFFNSVFNVFSFSFSYATIITSYSFIQLQISLTFIKC